MDGVVVHFQVAMRTVAITDLARQVTGDTVMTGTRVTPTDLHTAVTAPTQAPHMAVMATLMAGMAHMNMAAVATMGMRATGSMFHSVAGVEAGAGAGAVVPDAVSSATTKRTSRTGALTARHFGRQRQDPPKTRVLQRQSRHLLLVQTL